MLLRGWESNPYARCVPAPWQPICQPRLRPNPYRHREPIQPRSLSQVSLIRIATCPIRLQRPARRRGFEPLCSLELPLLATFCFVLWGVGICLAHRSPYQRWIRSRVSISTSELCEPLSRQWLSSCLTSSEILFGVVKAARWNLTQAYLRL